MKSLPRQTTTSVIEFLQRHDTAAGLLPAAQRILKLRADFFALIPGSLRSACEVSGFDDETVVVSVTSSGTAAKLRQTLPRVRDGLLKRGWKVSAIRMRVQPQGSSIVSRTWAGPSGADIPGGGIEAFAELSRDLKDSPLKSAVDRLIRRRSERP